MLCDLCHKREAVVHLTNSTSAGPLGVGPKTKRPALDVLTTSTYAELLGIGWKTKREKHYCEQCALSVTAQADRPFEAATKRQPAWKQIDASNAAVTFYLTGESVIRAATVPKPPNSRTPAIVRVSHSNCYGPVDSDIFVRLGNPKKPLGARDLHKMQEWQKAKVVEELIESDDGAWQPRGRAKGVGSYWSGTYEIEIQFPKGQRQIEIKVISRVEQVSSIVLSKWKVYVR
jgi:hypothetical protein